MLLPHPEPQPRPSDRSSREANEIRARRTMVAISLYRGNLHRVPAPNLRRWPPPPAALTLREFQILCNKRSRAALSLPSPSPTTSEGVSPLKDEEGMGDSGSNRIDSPSDVKDEVAEDAASGPVQESTVTVEGCGRIAGFDEVDGAPEVRMEVSDNLDIVVDKESRKTELEKKLKVLNEKKHHLVQMLKQILHAEEEIQRRSTLGIPASGLRASISVQPETVFEMGSVTRHAQKLSVDVNFGGDLGGEVDAVANHDIHPQNMNPLNTSPASLTRSRQGSLQQNTATHNPRATVLSVGHGQPSTPNSAKSIASASPSPFSPTVNRRVAYSTPVSAPGTNFAASTPSPASGGVSSGFRDSRLTSSL